MQENYTKVIDILYTAEQNGIKIILNGDSLQLRVPEHVNVNQTLTDEIKAHKQQIIAFLKQDSRNNNADSQYNKITALDKNTISEIPVSFSQERLWFVDRLQGSLQYHLSEVLLLEGSLDIESLNYTFRTIVNRHEVLRTTIKEKDGKAYQQVKAPDTWMLGLHLNNNDENGSEALKKHIDLLINEPFDLATDDMLRADIIKLKNDQHILIVTVHHIAADAWSMPILIKEIAALYHAHSKKQPLELSALPIQFSDYAVWQRENLHEQYLAEKIKYWKDKLQGVAPLQLPSDHDRLGAGDASGATLTFNVSQYISTALQKLSLQNGATLYMTLLAIFKVLLYRYSGQDDICVGTSIAGRSQPELEELIGFFVNTLALRDNVNGDESFTSLLSRVKQTVIDAFAHQDVPFERVVEATVKDREAGVSPLFQVMLVLGNTPEIPEIELGDLKLSGYGFEHNTVKFDLTVFVTETSNGLRCAVQYSTNLYYATRIERMVNHFKNLLTAVVANQDISVGKLKMLSNGEEQLIIDQGRSHCIYPAHKTIVDLFYEQALACAEFPAVVYEGKSLTYHDLNIESSKLAHLLRRYGVKAGALIPIYMERGIEMIIAIMGVIKSGAAYVPIDTDFPADRIKYILEDTGAAIILSSSKYAASIPDLEQHHKVLEYDELEWELSHESGNDPDNWLTTNHLVYVIYTSGSTGLPKGVAVNHGSLVDYVYGLNERTSVGRCSTFGLLSTIATDLGNTVIYSSLVYGGALHVFSKDTVSSISLLHQYFEDNRIDCIKIVPSHWKALSPPNDAPLLPAHLLVFGGEVLTKESVDLIRSYSDCRIINHYGPTETTIGKLLYEVGPKLTDHNQIPIGRPFSNTIIYILSKERELCPIGVPGELYIGGRGLANGYYLNEKLTRQKFVSDPYRKKGTVIYQTGDRVIAKADGNIEYLGRMDDQIKIRGYRVEPGEISRIMEKSDYVNQAVVIAIDDKQSGKQLVGYVVPSSKFSQERINAYLKKRLPDYMIPAIIIELGAIPLTVNGKIDRKSLPHPYQTSAANNYIAPVTETEIRLVDIWQNVLEVENIGIDHNFFELGGHSLLAIRLISEVRKEFGVELPIGEVFEYPTIALLATRLKQQELSKLPPIQVQPRPDRIPLSYSQERLWFIDQMLGSVQYHVPAIFRLSGTLNIEALQSAFGKIVERHEVLRTVIREFNGQGYQYVKTDHQWQLKQTDMAQLPAGLHIEAYIKKIIAVPFDLSNDDMLRVELIKINPNEYVLVLIMHHIASDGSSTAVLVNEWGTIYNALLTGKVPSLLKLDVQYADYAIWQQQYLKGDTLSKKLGYWQKKLANVAVMELPVDNVRPAEQSTNGALYEFSMSRGLADQLRAFSLTQEATFFMTLLSAFKVLLYRYSGQQDICVGSPVANRNQLEIGGLIGFFVNTLALRSNVDGDMLFTALLVQVKQMMLEAHDYQDVPFEKIVEVLVTVRDLSRSPLFQVMFVMQNTPQGPKLQLDGLNLLQTANDHDTAKFDITLFINENENGLRAAFEYNTDLYSEQTIARMAGHFQQLLNAIVTNPNQLINKLDIIGKSEKSLLESFNDTAVDYGQYESVITMFEAQVAENPDEIAVVFADEKLSYVELNDRSNQLARYLQKQGVVRETLVPIIMERGFEMLISILGILKAGGVYVPVDPEFPQERVSFMIADTGASLVLSSSKSIVHLPNTDVSVIEVDGADKGNITQESTGNLSVEISPEQLVYMLYTSGSTGKPKGVMMPHQAMVNLLKWQDTQFKNKKRRVLQFAAFTFDVSFQEIFSTICFGSTLYLIDADSRRDVYALSRHIDTNALTHLFFPFVVLQNLAEHFISNPLSFSRVEEIIIAGEQLKVSDEVKSLIIDTGIIIINQYGPTEAHVVTSYVLDSEFLPVLPPIGRPVSNTRIHILGGGGNEAPIGVPGEICIGGVQVARGYLNRAELTAEKFVRDPYSEEAGARLYRTGDVGRWLADGNVEYLGRIDDQVKIRGYRIELGEIESVLLQHSGIRQAVVLARADAAGNKRLTGYIVAEAGTYDKDELESYLGERLPEYMVPRLWVELESLPLTANGKTDKKALPEADVSEQLKAGYAAAETELEIELVKIWEELLGVEGIGTKDNFFELGGHSLLAMRVISRLRQSMGVELQIRDLFRYPRIGDLAARVPGLKRTADREIGVQVRPAYIPLSYSQERLWFIDRLEGSVQYHVPGVLKLSGKPDVQALEASLRTIVNRHEVLRTVIREHEGQGYQEVKEKDGWQLKQTDLSTITTTTNSVSTLDDYIAAAVQVPFDLSSDDMLRAELIKGIDGDYALLVVMHHIASDGWSMPVLVGEFRHLYGGYTSGREVKLSPLEIQYADYSIWQRATLSGALLEQKLDYWKTRLSGVATLQLPGDHTRPAVQGTAGSHYDFMISKAVSKGIQGLSLEHGVTPYMTLLSVFKVLLYRYSGQEDICVGSPVANRDREELSGLIGFFVNTLALRSSVKGETPFRELLAEVRETTLAAYEHQDVPFEKVVEAVVKERDLGRSPLFQVMFVLQNMAAMPELTLGDDIRISAEAVMNATSKYDLGMNLEETPEGIRVSVEYNTELYEKATIVRLSGHYLNLLDSVLKDPDKSVGELEMLGESELEELRSFNDTGVSYPQDATVISLFEAQAASTPGATALVFEGREMSYGELNSRSNQLARYLVKAGVQKETLVVICLERGFEMLISILGIMKAGGAYVPVDPEYPAERIGFMLSDTGAPVVLCSSNTNQQLQDQAGTTTTILIDGDWTAIAKEEDTNLGLVIDPGQLAYVIYTSGSTGKPKGVMVEHGNVANYSQGFARYFTLKATDIILQQSSVSFDTMCEEVYPALLSGAKIIIVKEGGKDIDGIKHFLEHEGVTILSTTPTVIEYLNKERDFKAENLRYIISGGEMLHPGFISQLSPKIQVVNTYGPSEGTVCATYHTIADIAKADIIGRPVSNTRIHILGAGGNEVPIGVPGEICIGGVQVARGYLNRAELTAEKFVRDPYSEEAGARLYRTGDVGRWLADGNVEYLGRIDDQVKIRGYRIELGEIESVLLQHNGIRQAVVLARADAAGNRRLTGYIVAEAGTYDKDELESYLGERLPEYMVPRLWVELESLPLTANGKTDKKALPEADVSEQLKAGYAAAETELEIELVKIWEELLGVEGIGTKDNFFELGGHSLLAMRVISRLRQSMGVELQIRDLFRYPRIGDLAARVPGLKRTADREIGVQVRPAYIPLSYSQERLWFIDRLEGSVQYHVPGVLKLSGKPDVQALEASLRTIVNRHEVLRTVIREHEGQGYQEVKEKDGWQLKQTDLSTITTTTNSVSTLDDYIAAAVQVPFDLSSDDMLRAELIKGIDGDYALLVVMHHIASDGWSMPVLVGEFRHLYGGYTSGREVKLSPLEIQYADYSIWQRATLSGALLEQKLDYWKTRLSGVATLQLPGDHTRPAVQGTAGSHYDFMISKAVSKGIQGLSLEHGVTPYMTLLSVFKVLLYRYSGQEDICVGSPVANRDREELSGLIGFFVNTLALRSSVKGETPFRELLAEVRETTLAAYEHQDVPFEKVVEAVVKERDLGRSPLFQVMFVLQNMAAMPELTLGDDIRISAEAVMNATSKYDLGMNLEETPEGIRVSVEYNTELYEKATIVRLSGHYLNLLDSVLKDPDKSVGELEMLGESELEELRSFNDTGVSYPQDATVISLFEAQAASTPGATALVFEGREMSYGELNSRSNQLARYLVKAGVKQETLVVICLERGFEMLISILGIMKAGGAYVPVDPEYPAERIGFMLSDTGAPVVLCSSNTNQQLQDQATTTTIQVDGDWTAITKEEDTNLGLVIDPGQLAYVIYTSGSTGKPKGVIVEQGSVMNRLNWGQGYFHLSSKDVVLQKTTFCFDVSVWELLWPLLCGAKIVLAKPGAQGDSAYLRSVIYEQKITLIHFVPSMLNVFLLDLEKEYQTELKHVLCSGEALTAAQVQFFREKLPNINLHNLYGPTEAAIEVTYWSDLDKNTPIETIPIGAPISNTQIYITAPNGTLNPIGVPGEICIGGIQVSRGYLNRPELTNEKFVNDTFGINNEGKLYKTGDIGRWMPNGNVEYLGRKDDQVKIRGYRIELGEIESRLQQHSTIRQAMVLAKEDKAGNKRLIGYLVVNNEYDKAEIEKYLQGSLPEYMVPRLWVTLENFPLTANGKVNKAAMPDIDVSAEAKDVYVAPRNETERQLAAIWQDLLGIDQVGIYDNFFELGGDSILTIQVVSKARKLGIEIQPKDIFQYQLIANLQEALQRNSTTRVKTEQGILQGEVGLLPIQQWYLEKNEYEISHFNQSVLFNIDKSITIEKLQTCIDLLVDQHDALRLRYSKTGHQWYQEYGLEYTQIYLTDLSQIEPQQLSTMIALNAQEHQKNLSITEGKLIRVVMMKTPDIENANRLFIVVHHLAVDGVSWRIILEDLNKLFDIESIDFHAKLGAKGSSYRQWHLVLMQYSQSNKLLTQKKYWEDIVREYEPLPGDLQFTGKLTMNDLVDFKVKLDKENTLNLLRNVPKVYHTEINDLLLAALAGSLHEWTGKMQMVIGLEGHGRELIADDVDISRTVGWFTSLYPVKLTGSKSPEVLIKETKEELRKVKEKGLGYGVLKYINRAPGLQGGDAWDVIFNYLGQLDHAASSGNWLRPANEETGVSISGKQSAHARISINSYVINGELVFNWSFSNKHYSNATINKFSSTYLKHLVNLISHCMELGKVGAVFTPADYGLGEEINYQDFEKFLNDDNIDNIMSF